jgi:hypothetical protein
MYAHATPMEFIIRYDFFGEEVQLLGAVLA